MHGCMQPCKATHGALTSPLEPPPPPVVSRAQAAVMYTLAHLGRAWMTQLNTTNVEVRSSGMVAPGA